MDTTSGPGLRKNVPWQSREMIFRPYGAWSFGAWIPRLTPRALFFCRFAAETTRNAIAASRLGYGQSRLGLCRSVAGNLILTRLFILNNWRVMIRTGNSQGRSYNRSL